MSSKRQTPAQQRRETRREAQSLSRHGGTRQDFSNRDFQHGTQRNETQIEGGQRRDDAGNIAPVATRPEQEQGDSRRPYKRSGR